jgi:anti-sigma factor RsiW
MDAPSHPPSSPPPRSSDDSDDEIIAALSDYYDGLLPEAQRAEIEHKISSDSAWRSIDEELRAQKPLLASLGKVSAPPRFSADVTATIHRRSRGRFFAKRTLGDRLPVGLLVIVAAILLGAMASVWCRSTTGSLRSPVGTEAPRPPPSNPLAPTP